MRRSALCLVPGLGLLAAAAALHAAGREPPDIRLFFQAAGRDEKRARAALESLAASWRDGYAGPLIDLARLLPGPRRSAHAEESLPAPDEEPAAARPGATGFPALPAPPVDPRRRVRQRLTRFLEKQTGQRHGDDLRAWRRWLWSSPREAHPHYAAFKARLYAEVDPRLAAFFRPGPALIRLDEVDWGGVAVNGIPPLDHPRHVPSGQAPWLKDTHVVFGVALGGEARAYPKRVLAWHELARDRLGGVEITVVFCTLCGTVIPYASEVGGRRLTFGTSGLLYRSNKLLFDEETLSLWSTLTGRPVIGPLAGSGLELTAFPVVTTTWREWRAAHPETTVLSRETGHDRDYSEGAAYRDYFATDRLMFEVPRTDPRLENKAEVLTLWLRPPGSGPEAARRALALSAAFLEDHPVHALRFAGHDLVVVTSPDGANRVYGAAGTAFRGLLPGGRVADAAGQAWRVTEEALVHESTGQRRTRVAAWRAFWFGWYAQFPHTELVK